MIDVSNSPRSLITISSHLFEVPAPFVEGHVLRANEAAVLNQTYAENIRNNFNSTVREAVEAAKTNGASVDLTQLQEKLNKYITEYDFGVRNRGEPRVYVDPVDRETRNIAISKVRDALKKKGIKVAAMDKAKMAELVDQVIAKYPQLREQAVRIVEAKKSAGADSLDIAV